MMRSSFVFQNVTYEVYYHMMNISQLSKKVDGDGGTVVVVTGGSVIRDALGRVEAGVGAVVVGGGGVTESLRCPHGAAGLRHGQQQHLQRRNRRK